MALFGNQIQFKINSWIPKSNRFTRDYETEPVQYISYNEQKTVKYVHRGLKEIYTITLYDWDSSDIIFFNGLENNTAKNMMTFTPSLDAVLTKLSYFEYYPDPFNKTLEITIIPVWLLNYTTLPALTTYSNIIQEFGNNVRYTQPVLNNITLPVKTVCKISVDFDVEEKISITGKIHREYKYIKNGSVYKKTIFSGSSFDITDALYNSLISCQGVSETIFSINGKSYAGVPIIDFKRILKNQWLMNFKFEVQYIPVSIRYVAHAIPDVPADLTTNIRYAGTNHLFITGVSEVYTAPGRTPQQKVSGFVVNADDDDDTRPLEAVYLFPTLVPQIYLPALSAGGWFPEFNATLDLEGNYEEVPCILKSCLNDLYYSIYGYRIAPPEVIVIDDYNHYYNFASFDDTVGNMNLTNSGTTLTAGEMVFNLVTDHAIIGDGNYYNDYKEFVFSFVYTHKTVNVDSCLVGFGGFPSFGISENNYFASIGFLYETRLYGNQLIDGYDYSVILMVAKATDGYHLRNYIIINGVYLGRIEPDAFIYELDGATITINNIVDYNSTVAGAIKITTMVPYYEKYITIVNTINYNGKYEAVQIDDTNFYVIATYISDETVGGVFKGWSLAGSGNYTSLGSSIPEIASITSIIKDLRIYERRMSFNNVEALFYDMNATPIITDFNYHYELNDLTNTVVLPNSDLINNNCVVGSAQAVFDNVTDYLQFRSIYLSDPGYLTGRIDRNKTISFDLTFTEIVAGTTKILELESTNIGISSSGKIQIAETTPKESDFTPVINVKYRLSIIFDGIFIYPFDTNANINIFIDNVLILEVSSFVTSGFTINSIWRLQGFKGVIEDIKIWNRSLNINEIALL